MTSPFGASPKLAGSVLNLVNNSLGAGILALPLYFSLLGWLLGCVLLVALAALSLFTATLMAMVGLAEHAQSYHMAVQHTLGRPLRICFQWLIIAGAKPCTIYLRSNCADCHVCLLATSLVLCIIKII